MNINSTTALTTQASTATNSTASNVSTLQKLQQEQRQQTLQQAKPVVEQVYISQQGQQQLETYAKSAANAAQRYDTGSESSSASNLGVSTEQILKAVDKQQNRQTAAALASYAQQQAQASNDKPVTAPKPTPYTQTTSIQESA